MPNVPYQNLIGSLMYLSLWSRPDITQAVNYLSQFNSCFGDEHWACAKRVLRYLKGTLDHCLVYCKNDEGLCGYSDADWDSDSVDRKSYSGYVFTFGGGVISWMSKKQSLVAQSSTEAEYVSLAKAGNEAIYLRNFLEELIGEVSPVTLFCDNKAAIFLSNNAAFQKRTKHIDIVYHHVRNLVNTGQISVQHMPSEDMVADIFTKSLPYPRFRKFVELLGVIQVRD
ncbi:secreted RxLR effector protein 161-like [Ischnura elegans]|uniref:secreted RxLR effector protein 161-like n=1 Tax=Ischnura elegans TaxID=197161 RepID=UPI001ED886AB|nr:secreted RxLR effector protein 161-like [Ischnura elegans]